MKMQPITIKAGVADIIEFNGQVLYELKWSLKHHPFSAHLIAYETDTNKIVIVSYEWNDEETTRNDSDVRYSILDKSELTKCNSFRGWVKNHVLGLTPDAMIHNAVRKAFPRKADKSGIAEDFAKVLESKLGIGPNIVRKI